MESTQRWLEVDRYFAERLSLGDDALDAALRASDTAGLPAISVSPAQGAMLSLFARMLGARRILEVGTLGGYSAIWLSRGMAADGELVTLELDPRHAEVARSNLARAGMADRVRVIVGPAAESLQRLHAAGEGPFDLVFIDADKPSNATYLEWALRMSRPGTLIVVDNVVRGGAVADADSTDASVAGVRRALDLIAADPRLEATAIQTVGLKGYDGFAMALVRGA
jgi:predicted O-methyltransferase YrrM